MIAQWTGPRDGEIDAEGKLTRDLPPERFPYCHGEEHDRGCLLTMRQGQRGSFCDCGASCADDDGITR